MTLQSAPDQTTSPYGGWAVVLAADEGGRLTVVVHPVGITVLSGSELAPILMAGADRVSGHLLTWAWGHVPAEAETPRVWFGSRWALVESSAAVRRLSATVWAAQTRGRWHHVRLA